MTSQSTDGEPKRTTRSSSESRGRREGGSSRSSGRSSGGGHGERGERGDRRGGPRRDSKPPVADAPKGPPAVQLSQEAWDELLGAVSRSFSMSIRILPEALREPIAVAYLMARTTDTLADTVGVPAETRREALIAFVEMMKYGAETDVLNGYHKKFAPKQEHEGEKVLLENMGALLARYESLGIRDREEVLWVLLRISHGQELDLKRFDAEAVQGSGETKRGSLATAAELEEYTYLVAGCVGEFWTRICARHCEGFSRAGMDDLLKWGRHFGQALQLTNILRDLPEDLKAGRCYLPADELGEQPSSETLKKVRDQWALVAAKKLDEAWRYTLSMETRSLRFACAMPVLLADRTLALLKRPESMNEKLKISRGQTKRLIFLLSAACWSRTLLSALRGKSA